MEFSSFLLAASLTSLIDIPKSIDKADVIEFRMDLSSNPISELSSYEGELPIIVTNRVESEGGGSPESPGRIDLLCRAMEIPAVEAIDIELSAALSSIGEKAIDFAKKHGVSTIISTHDFNSTPSLGELDSILRHSTEIGDLGKLSVTAQTEGDVISLMLATWNSSMRGETVATISMGPIGMHSRVIAPFYGSKLGYASPDENNITAPGQYTIQDMRNLLNLLS